MNRADGSDSHSIGRGDPVGLESQTPALVEGAASLLPPQPPPPPPAAGGDRESEVRVFIFQVLIVKFIFLSDYMRVYCVSGSVCLVENLRRRIFYLV